MLIIFLSKFTKKLNFCVSSKIKKKNTAQLIFFTACSTRKNLSNVFVKVIKVEWKFNQSVTLMKI